MKDTSIYLIQLRGKVTEREINNMSPQRATVVQIESAATLVSISTDQSGLIGLLRHLHGQGYVFLSVNCES